ncbi:tetratricopeptide repeat protein [Streptomyces erythrochromogenes]|uniref:tetratricopeptide repeat protein n=1 Tax=Streptomyces erythrochromogenes TaxID=285574 RepID=UPI00369E8BED
MDAAELDHRSRTRDGWIPPDLVARLIDRGHAETVRERALDGDWFCARGRARDLAARGRAEQALAALAPYAATGWWDAVGENAELLDRTGRTEEAVRLVRPYAEAGERAALRHLALMLSRQGRAEEAYALLRPHIGDRFLAEPLVEVSAGQGRDEEVAALLRDRARPDRPCGRCGGAQCPGGGARPSNAAALLAAVLERQGRTDEAVEVLRTHPYAPVGGRDPLAELLARHGRIDDLRARAAASDDEYAARRLAELLESRGDVAGAVEAYRPHAAAGRGRASVLLARLLARHGRGDEAVDVLRALDSADDWILDELCALYAAGGRSEEGLAHLDAVKARRGREEWEVFRLRAHLLAGCGRLDEAVEGIRAHLEGAAPYAAEELARLLAGAGRPEEAVAVLDPELPDHGRALAELLLDLGRIDEAVAVLRRPHPPIPPPDPAGYSDCPPF